MTLDDARRLQEKWKANHGGTTCYHKQLHNDVMPPTESQTTQRVCMECGEELQKT